MHAHDIPHGEGPIHPAQFHGLHVTQSDPGETVTWLDNPAPATAVLGGSHRAARRTCRERQ
jgi:hypothetical protein